MEELKKALKLQAKLYNADTAYVSISTLDMGRKYPIDHFNIIYNWEYD